jgi:hypothetical protein
LVIYVTTELRDGIRDAVKSVDEDMLRIVMARDCILIGRVPWKPHRAPMNRNLNVGRLFQSNSFSNM